MFNDSQKQTLNSILKYYLDRHAVRNGSSATSLRFGPASVSALAFSKMIIRDGVALNAHCGMKEMNRVREVISEQHNLSDPDDVSKELSSLIFGQLKAFATKQHVKSLVGEGKGNEIIKEYKYENVRPILDINTCQQVMFNTKTGNVVHSISPEAYEKWVKKQPKEISDVHNTLFTPALISFDPKTSGDYKYVETEDYQEVISVNSHNMPAWRKTELKNPVLPKYFDELMHHMFPQEMCRRYVYTWIYHMLDSRSSIHLLLHSHRGIGKNTFIYILANLVGPSNYYYVPKDFFDNNFNSELRHRRLLYFDEHTINTKVNEAEFKQYHEPQMAYHGKGMPIVGIEDNHSSNVISNNTEVTNHLVYESRRYSVPFMNHIPIKDAKGKDWLDEIHRLKTDPDFLANLGWWILQNAEIEKFSPEDPYKSSLFYDLVHKALYPWQKFLIDLIRTKDNEKYDIKDYQVEGELWYGRKGIGRQQVDTFLRSHKDIDGEVYAEVKLIDKKRYIVPSYKYQPEEEF